MGELIALLITSLNNSQQLATLFQHVTFEGRTELNDEELARVRTMAQESNDRLRKWAENNG